MDFTCLGNFIRHTFYCISECTCVCHYVSYTQGGGHSIVKKYGGAGSIVWGLGFWLGKDILGFLKNIDLDNS